MEAEARATIAEGVLAGPFEGVPFLLKDITLSYAGVPTDCGSRFFKGWTRDFDSEMVVRWKRAGLVMFAKTNTPEAGSSGSTEPVANGPTHNPWKLGYSPGGSSGGSAAAVASGIAPAGHANDGGGSIRIPASACGLVGLKPSRGRTPNGPDFGELWNGIAIEHAVTRSVRDCAALLDATAGPGVGEPYYAPPPHGHLFADDDAEVFFERLMEFIPFTPIFNCTGNPAITLPLSWNGEGLPIGVHFGGRMADEAALFRLAAQLEEARPWQGRHPETSVWSLS